MTEQEYKDADLTSVKREKPDGWGGGWIQIPGVGQVCIPVAQCLHMGVVGGQMPRDWQGKEATPVVFTLNPYMAPYMAFHVNGNGRFVARFSGEAGGAGEASGAGDDT